MQTDVATLARPKSRTIIGKPPFFAIFCVLIWAAALAFVFTHQSGIDTTPFMGP